MKIGIVGDIHGNKYAFEKVSDELKRERCDMVFFLGDVCGYYCYEDGVIDLLRTWPGLIGIAGNHEDIFLRSLKDSRLEDEYAERYGLSNKFLGENIKKENLEFLRSLPPSYILQDYNLAFFHGSPWDPLNEYIYPDSKMVRFKDLPSRVVFLGHTHYPMDIEDDGIRIINPGSAGQPRDGGWPSYAVFDCDKNTLSIKRVPYNVEALIDEVKMRKEKNPYLADVLRRIRR